MARLASIEKAAFYCTPPRVTELIRDSINVKGPGRLLDICAGEGDAAATLANAWGLESYGVELHAGRAALADSKMTCCLHGSYHQLDQTQLEGAFNALFLNPPYDEGFSERDDGYTRGRQEIEFLKFATELLAVGGLLVYVVPAAIVENYTFIQFIKSNFESIEVYKFPDPEYDRFKQVVLIATRASENGAYFRYFHAKEEWPVLRSAFYREGVEICLPSVGEPVKFDLTGSNPYAIAPDFEIGEGAYGTAQWNILTGNSSLGSFDRPLLPPRPGHQAMLLAAGALNGVELAGQQIVKGRSEKVIVAIDDAEAKQRIERERIVSNMSVLDLTTGKIESWRTDADIDRTRAWFEEHGAALTIGVRLEHQPLFNGDLSVWDFSGLQPPGHLPGCPEPLFLPKQKEAAAAVAWRWANGNKSAVICGERGSGKTSMAILASELIGSKKTIVMCPPHLVRKWAREVDKITGRKCSVIIGGSTKAKEPNLKVVDRFFSDSALNYLILSDETAKLGARWKGRVNYKKVRIVKEEPYTQKVDYYPYYKPGVKTVKYTVYACRCPDCFAVQVDPDDGYLAPEYFDDKKRKCQQCKTALWQVAPISNIGTRRWAPAKYINQRYSGRFALVIDEVHRVAKIDSDRSRAAQHLAAAAVRILAMTGTLYGGRASSIFHLLYKVDPGFRALYRYNECPVFVAHHGLLETVYDTSDETSVYGNRRREEGGRVREIPGVNPAMITLLLPYTVFVMLEDLGYELPPFEETVELVDHVPEVLTAVSELAGAVKTVLRKHPRVLGQYLMACLGYPDCPEHAEEIVDRGPDGTDHEELATAPAFPSQPWPKDVRLGEICVAEKAQGRRTLVFFTQVDKRSPVERVKAYLESLGLTVAVLTSSVDPEKREEWLHELVAKKNPDVLLTNGRLVETGLDLIDWPTIIQYGTEYSVHVLRQSTRRSWRLGQTLLVKVIYLGYRHTMQHVALELISKKMRAAEVVDGAHIGGLSQFDDAGSNLLMDIARAAVGMRGEIEDEAA